MNRIEFREFYIFDSECKSRAAEILELLKRSMPIDGPLTKEEIKTREKNYIKDERSKMEMINGVFKSQKPNGGWAEYAIKHIFGERPDNICWSRINIKKFPTDATLGLKALKESHVNCKIKMYKKWKIKMYIYPCYTSAS